MKKKVLAVILAVLMATAILPATVSADDITVRVIPTGLSVDKYRLDIFDAINAFDRARAFTYGIKSWKVGHQD